MNKETLAKGAVAIIIALFFIGIFFIYAAIYKSTEEDIVIKCNGKDRVSYGSGKHITHKYLIYSDVDTFECTDSHIYGKYNSSNIYGSFEKGKKYKVKVAGFRVQFLSWYKNIIKSTEEKE